jgi:hypothetical protein
MHASTESPAVPFVTGNETLGGRKTGRYLHAHVLEPIDKNSTAILITISGVIRDIHRPRKMAVVKPDEVNLT